MSNRSKLLAGLLVGTGLLLTACGKSDAPKEKAGAGEGEAATPVTVATAERGPIRNLITADAVLFPINQASVTSKISAPVKQILVNRGAHVKAGQLLAELESRDLAAAAQESKSLYNQAEASYRTTSGATVPEDRTKAEADLRAAQQGLEAAKRVYDSRVTLAQQGALAQKLVEDAKLAMVQAQSQFDTAQRHLESVQRVSGQEAIKGSEAQVQAARAHLESANAQLSYTRIVSPISGVVSDRPVYPGEMAASGTAIISIVNVSQLVARANISVKDASAIRVGRAATISAPGGELHGKVTVVSPAVDPNTTTVEVWIQAPNPGEKVKPGSTARVSIVAQVMDDAVLVPKEALLNSDEGGEKVMVVGADNKAQERKVTVGVREPDKVQIVSGVKVGERVIVSGGLALEDKAKVDPKQAGEKDDDKKDDKSDDKKDDKEDKK